MRNATLLSVIVCCLWTASTVTQSAPMVEKARETLKLNIGASVKITLDRPMVTASVSSPAVGEAQIVTDQVLIVFARGLGETSIFAMDGDGKTIWSAALEVVPNLSKARRELEREYPNLDISVEAAANGRIVVKGTVPNATAAADIIGLVDAHIGAERREGGAQAAGQADAGQGAPAQAGTENSVGRGEGVTGERFGRIVNRLTVLGGGQVTIRVRVAEISRSIRERFGLRWSGLEFRTLSANFGFAQSPIIIPPVDGLSGVIGGLDNVIGLIDLLAQENLVSVLAEPNLTVSSGETASFVSGGELPLPVIQDGDIAIEFKPFGVLLNVTPTILANNRISMRIRPEVSEPSDTDGITVGGNSVPTIIVRRADTTVELASGQSFALAGLLNSDLSDTVSKFPFLGDLPIIGALARSSEFERGDSELVIIATASISRPTDEVLAVPNDNVELASPFERLFLGRSLVPRSVRPLGFVY